MEQTIQGVKPKRYCPACGELHNLARCPRPNCGYPLVDLRGIVLSMSPVNLLATASTRNRAISVEGE